MSCSLLQRSTSSVLLLSSTTTVFLLVLVVPHAKGIKLLEDLLHLKENLLKGNPAGLVPSQVWIRHDNNTALC